MAPGSEIAAIFVTRGGSTAGVPPEVLRLAEALKLTHGDVLVPRNPTATT